MNQRARTLSFIVVIELYLLSWHTLIFRFNPMLLILGDGIKIAAPIALFLLCGNRRMLPVGQPILLAYLVITVYFVGLVLGRGSSSERIEHTAKYLAVVMLPLVLFIVLNPANLYSDFVKSVCVIGGLLAAHSIVLVSLLVLGYEVPQTELAVESYGDGFVSTFGYWGLSTGTRAPGTEFEVFRAQSFFWEPTNFACFLEPAIIISYGIFRLRGSKWMAINALVCLVAFILTLSVTGYICIFIVALIAYSSRHVRRRRFSVPLVWTATGVLGVVSLVAYLSLVGSAEFYNANKIGYGLARPTEEFSERYRFFTESIGLFRTAPFGIGVPSPGSSQLLEEFPGARESRMAPMLWLVMQGIVGLMLQLFIVGYVSRLALAQITKPHQIGRYVALSFLCCLLHECLAGDWFDALYLFLLVSVVAMSADNFKWGGPEIHSPLRRTGKGGGRDEVTADCIVSDRAHLQSDGSL